MQKNPPVILFIASLPSLPNHGVSHDLVLQYSLERKQGTFLYNTQQLQMTCFVEKVQKSTGSRNYEKKSLIEQVDQTEIPCDWLHAWLQYGMNWPQEQHFHDSGFTFDTSTQTWCNHKHSYRRSFAFHDTYYDTIEITLKVDLVQLRGKYIERDQHETVD
jgi:hypothetical protein